MEMKTIFVLLTAAFIAGLIVGTLGDPRDSNVDMLLDVFGPLGALIPD